jgi:protein-S-isoprenylcysteine O-methyltransferase Ste14
MPSMEVANRDRPATVWLLVKLAVFTLFVPGTVTVWLPLFYMYPGLRHRPMAWNAHALGGLILIALGAAGYFWCALDFAFAGRGTPAPIDPPKFLVARGLYRFSRNPMYLSVLTVLAGESLLFWSARLLGYAACVAVLFHLFVYFYEEPNLKKRMGAAYEQYVQDVPRWIPRFRRAERTNAL